MVKKLTGLQQQHPKSYCQSCFRGPATAIEMLQYQGMLIAMKEIKYHASVCRRCGWEFAKSVMGRHLATTWWSPLSLVIGATVGTAANGLAMTKIKLLKEPCACILPEHREVL
ncbi:MAG TPA: hypothetical protein VKX17_14355 [Planctomycetota bacterium]|nr:hypothetical protein [Planctomycetota bacterium]